MKSFVIVILLLWMQGVEAKVKNVILFIGDGMGYGQIQATGLYFNGKVNSLSFEGFPVRGEVTTHSASSPITDSAAAATAIATGQKTNNGYVGRDTQARDLPNILELLKYKGKTTGVITTVSVDHATPASFAAHEDFREKKNGIIDSMLSDTRPNLIWGAAGEINPEWASFKGYQVVKNLKELAALAPSSRAPFISGQFGKDDVPWETSDFGELPRLSEMTFHALRLLADSPEGFFLMIEGGKIDWASHKGDLLQAVHEVRGLADSVAVALAWMEDRDDTLLLVTADHETGGLDLGAARGVGQVPEHSWKMPRGSDGSLTHSDRKVPLYARGVGEELFQGSYDNTDIFKKLVRLQELEFISSILSTRP